MFPFKTSLDFRITIGVLITWTLLLRFLPKVCFIVSFIAAGCFILYQGFNGLRNGEICVKAAVDTTAYSRRNNPIEFWFYILFFGLLGIALCIYPIYHLIKS